MRTVRARVRVDGREYAEVAVPLLTAGNVMLLSSSLSDQLATVALVKRRLLYATVVALLIAVETIPDIFRTLGNVSADVAVTTVAARDRGAP